MARGDIIYIDLPVIPDSHVQGGRRPAVFVIADVAVKKNPLIMVVPLTSKLATARFRFTFEITPSPQNGLPKPSVALVFQLCAADPTRVEAVIGRLEDHYMAQIDEMMREMLGL